MIKVLDLHPRLASALPETYAILRSSNLTVHECVSRLILHGSRGLANKCRADSDIDLSLITDIRSDSSSANLEFLQSIYETTRRHWKSNVELDLAVVFDAQQCQLKCFERNTWDAQFCTLGDTDYFGLYKPGKGFNGLVENAGVHVERMYPCLKIWERT